MARTACGDMYRGKWLGHAMQGTQGRMRKLRSAKSLAGLKVQWTQVASRVRKVGVSKIAFKGKGSPREDCASNKVFCIAFAECFETYVLGLGLGGRMMPFLGQNHRATKGKLSGAVVEGSESSLAPCHVLCWRGLRMRWAQRPIARRSSLWPSTSGKVRQRQACPARPD